MPLELNKRISLWWSDGHRHGGGCWLYSPSPGLLSLSSSCWADEDKERSCFNIFLFPLPLVWFVQWETDRRASYREWSQGIYSLQVCFCQVTVSWLHPSIIGHLSGSSLRILPIRIPSGIGQCLLSVVSLRGLHCPLLGPLLGFLNSIHLFVNSPLIKLSPAFCPPGDTAHKGEILAKLQMWFVCLRSLQTFPHNMKVISYSTYHSVMKKVCPLAF